MIYNAPFYATVSTKYWGFRLKKKRELYCSYETPEKVENFKIQKKLHKSIPTIDLNKVKNFLILTTTVGPSY